MTCFPDLERVCCSMSSSNWCFLTCIQITQEAGKVVWYSHFFKNFPQFVVIHTVKGFSIVNEAVVDVFLEFFCWGGTNWKILREMGIPDHLTCLLRNLYAGQEAPVRTRHGTTDWFQIGKGVCQVYCHPAYLIYMHSTS